MYSCAAGLAGLLALWALIPGWHFFGGGQLPALGHGLGYAGLAAYAMALAGRCVAAWHPALRRMSVLMFCAALAGGEVGLRGLQGEAAQKTFFAALLGTALVVMAARLAPAGLRRRWLGEGA